MFKALVKTRMAALWASLTRTRRSSKNDGKARSGLAKAGMAVLFIYLAVVFLGMFGAMFGAICVPFYSMGIAWMYFAIAASIATVLCFIGSVFTAQNQLYGAKDNELLLSMPVKPSAILASRMVMLLILNYFYEALVVLPAVGVWIINRLPVSVAGALCTLIAFLILPLMPLTLSCLLGWAIAAITARMRNKNIISIVFSLAFMGAYFYFYSNIQRYIEKLVALGSDIAPAFEKAVPPFYWLGMASAEGDIAKLIFFILCCAVPFALLYMVLARSFIGIATEKRTAAKIKYKGGQMHVRRPMAGLVDKEIRRFAGNAMYMLNAGIGLLMMLLAVVFLAIKRDGLMAALLSDHRIMEGAGPFAAFIICMLCGMVLISAPSISIEGKSLWIMQTLPVKGCSILRAKALAHIIIAEPFVIVSSVAAAILLEQSFVMGLMITLLAAVYTIFTAYLGVLVNLRFPRFDWINEVTAIKSSMAVMLTMFIGMAAVAVLFVPYVIAFANMKLFIGPELYLLLCAVFFGAIAAIMDIYFKKSGGARFEFLS